MHKFIPWHEGLLHRRPSLLLDILLLYSRRPPPKEACALMRGSSLARARAHLIAAQARGRRRSAWLYGLAMAVDSARLRGSGRGPMSGASANTATVSYADAHRGSDSARHCGAALYRAAHASISCSTCEEVRHAPRRTRSPTVQTRTKKGLPSLKYAMAAAGG